MKIKKKQLSALILAAAGLAGSLPAIGADEVSKEASKKPAPTDQQVFSALNIMAIPIGPKGMVVKDDQNCLWLIKNTGGVPHLVAVLGESTGAPLCGDKGPASKS